jgi:hypothetical protein
MMAEVNSKLQAILEDTLAKNMQLQDSVALLGLEVERLRKNSV